MMGEFSSRRQCSDGRQEHFFFHQEIAGDGRVLQGDGLALLSIFFIRKWQVMDVFFEETDWLCSPGTSFVPLGELHGEGANTQTDRHCDY